MKMEEDSSVPFLHLVHPQFLTTTGLDRHDSHADLRDKIGERDAQPCNANVLTTRSREAVVVRW
jgi:hypothetical protein